MALTAPGLKAAILNELNAVAPLATGTNTENAQAWRDKFAEAVAKAVIEYLKANAEVASLTPLPVTHPMGPGSVNPFTLPPGTTLK